MRFRKGALRGLAVAAAISAAVVGNSPTSGALAPDAYGWWNKVQQVPLVVLPAPPTAPAEGIYVAGDPSGATAIGALRFGVTEGVGAQLTLKIQSGSASSGAVLACAATSPWDGGGNQSWGTRPTYDANRCAAGTVTGTNAVWELPDTIQATPGRLDLVLAPAGVFQVGFQKPDDGSLVEVAAEPEDDFAASPDASTDFYFDDSMQSDFYASPDSYVSDFAGDVTLPAMTGDIDSAAAPPSAGRTAQPAVSANPLGPDASRADRMLAVGLLLAIGATMWWLGGQSVRAPRLLGSLGSDRSASVVDAGQVGGIGRFAKPRARTARRLG